MSSERDHPSLATLRDYWLHDSDEATTDAVDLHVLGCDACGRALDELAALAGAVRAAFRDGAVATVASAAFVQRLKSLPTRVREYVVARDGGVDCTVAPDDELLASRLQAPLRGVERVDVVAESSIAPGVRHRIEDVPFEPDAGEIVWLPKIAEVRQLPAHTLTVRLLSVTAQGERELGRYEFRHRPWGEP